MINRCFKAKIFALTLLFLLASCASDDPIIDKSLGYQDFIRDDMSNAEVNSTSKRTITLPAPQATYTWSSSNFSLSQVPENISGPDASVSGLKRYSLRNASTVHSDKTIVIAGDSILWLSGNTLYAYDIAHPSKLKWSSIISQDTHDLIGGGIYARDDHVAVTCGSKDFVVLDIRSGNVVWAFSLANIARSAPIIHNKTVIVNTVDNTLYGFDLDTGAMKWLVKEAHEKLGFLGAASPEFFEDTVIMPFSSGKLVSINIANGQTKWSASLSLGLGVKSYINDVDMVPVIKNGTLFLSSNNGILYAMDPKTGALKWSNLQAGGGGQIWSAGEYVYTINKNNVLLALYKEDGSIQWATHLADPNTKKGESIFFDDDNTVFRGPTIINNKLYVTSSEGVLVVIDPISGEKLNEISIPKSGYSPVIAVNNKIYIINSFGSLSVIG